MLSQRHRLRRNVDFSLVMRRGRKINRGAVVLYALAQPETRFGVVVGKAVGGAVQRNLVKRRLRHGAAGLIDDSPAMAVVVRALPGAVEAGPHLVEDMSSAWRQAARSLA